MVIPLAISWGIWTTTSVFSLDKKQAVTDQCVKDMCQDISEIKYKLDDTNRKIVDTKEDINRQVFATKEEILRLLLSINREVKAKRLP
jgi:hypothetical protein